MSTLAVERAAIWSQISRLNERLKQLDQLGVDDFPDDAVLMFTRPGWSSALGGRTALTYVALKKGGGWWVSNGLNRRYTWGELVVYMSQSPEVWVVSGWDQVA